MSSESQVLPPISKDTNSSTHTPTMQDTSCPYNPPVDSSNKSPPDSLHTGNTPQPYVPTENGDTTLPPNVPAPPHLGSRDRLDSTTPSVPASTMGSDVLSTQAQAGSPTPPESNTHNVNVSHTSKISADSSSCASQTAPGTTPSHFSSGDRSRSGADVSLHTPQLETNSQSSNVPVSTMSSDVLSTQVQAGSPTPPESNMHNMNVSHTSKINADSSSCASQSTPGTTPSHVSSGDRSGSSADASLHTPQLETNSPNSSVPASTMSSDVLSTQVQAGSPIPPESNTHIVPHTSKINADSSSCAPQSTPGMTPSHVSSGDRSRSSADASLHTPQLETNSPSSSPCFGFRESEGANTTGTKRDDESPVPPSSGANATQTHTAISIPEDKPPYLHAPAETPRVPNDESVRTQDTGAFAEDHQLTKSPAAFNTNDTESCDGKPVSSVRPSKSDMPHEALHEQEGPGKSTADKEATTPQEPRVQYADDVKSGAGSPSVPSDKYPDQKHAGKLDGVGPHYSEMHGATLGEKIKGIKEQVKGVLKGDDGLKQLGKERRTGELKKQQQEEKDQENPFANAKDDE